LEERLLDLPNRIRDAVELVGLPKGQKLADHDGFREDFDEAADAIINLVLTKGIVEEATGPLGP
jgi:hypothetical protein